MGFHIYATRGTSTYLREHGLQTTTVYTISQKMDPDALGLMRGEDQPHHQHANELLRCEEDGYMMRRLAVELEIPFLTTVQAARATVSAMRKAAAGRLRSWTWRRIIAPPPNGPSADLAQPAGAGRSVRSKPSPWSFTRHPALMLLDAAARGQARCLAWKRNR